jgi:hypothetical protein
MSSSLQMAFPLLFLFQVWQRGLHMMHAMYFGGMALQAAGLSFTCPCVLILMSCSKAHPRRQHEKALIKILCYLKGTPNKGLIITPRKALGLECYVDADFASSWCKETSQDPPRVLSRSGYVTRLYDCPILWVSKLQTEIALSTTMRANKLPSAKQCMR